MTDTERIKTAIRLAEGIFAFEGIYPNGYTRAMDEMVLAGQRTFDDAANACIEYARELASQAGGDACDGAPGKDNPYYCQHGVQFNLLGIHNAALLHQVEGDASLCRAKAILSGQALQNLRGWGEERLRRIHAYLFGGIYGWAGECRTVGFAKLMRENLVSAFLDPHFFATGFAEMEKKATAFAKAKGMSEAQKLAALVDFFCCANHLHPFPEGNGRALQLFITQLAHTQGLHLEWPRITPSGWNQAAAFAGVYGHVDERGQLHTLPPKTELLEKIFAHMLAPSVDRSLSN